MNAVKGHCVKPDYLPLNTSAFLSSLDMPKLNHPAHRCLDLRFATHLTMCNARLEVRMDSLFPFLQGLAPLQHVGLSRRTSNDRHLGPLADFRFAGCVPVAGRDPAHWKLMGWSAAFDTRQLGGIGRY